MNRQFILFSLLLFLMHSSYCNTDEKTIRDKRFVLGLDLGLTETNQLGRRVSFPLGYSTFNYIPNKKTSFSARYGISLGRTFALNSVNNIIIGLGYHQFTAMTAKGTLQQGISPPLYEANYQYKIQSSQLLAEVKAQHKWHQMFYPYLTAGIGGGFNSAKHFKTTVPDYLTVTPTYAAHSRSSLSYMLGLGIDAMFASNTTVGIGYVFSDLGQVGLGNGSIRARTLSSYLNQSHLYINTILVQLNWHF